jgi:kinesin family protein 15
MNDLEREQTGEQCIHVEDDETVSLQIEDSDHKFTFDKVLDQWATQQDVYEAAAAPLVEGVLNGFNSAIIAYGQTGSGKTFTMSGPLFEDPRKSEYALRQNTKGIIPRLVEDLFYHINLAPQGVGNCYFIISVLTLQNII